MLYKVRLKSELFAYRFNGEIENDLPSWLRRDARILRGNLVIYHNFHSYCLEVGSYAIIDETSKIIINVVSPKEFDREFEKIIE